MGFWIVALIVVFVVGSIFGLRISPREKALGEMRDLSRRIGLYPRLVAAPDWTKIPKMTENRASMVAYYSVLLPKATLPLMRAIIVDGQFDVVYGAEKFQHYPFTFTGVYAIDMQANSIGMYWDEETNLQASQLEDIKSFLISLAKV